MVASAVVMVLPMTIEMMVQVYMKVLWLGMAELLFAEPVIVEQKQALLLVYLIWKVR
jgi:hypothetical protein